MKTFTTFDLVDDMLACVKRPVVVHAKQIHEEFRVDSLEGNYKQGKPGDYLMRGVKDELYICDKEIFEMTYRFLSSGDVPDINGADVANIGDSLKDFRENLAKIE